jgi:hypothetical protein
MENIQQFIYAIEDYQYGIQAFKISYLYKYICLQNYKYKPRLNICNQVIHEWKHSNKEETLTVDRIRQILVDELWEALSERQNEILSESQHYEANDKHHEKFQKKIKNIAEICIWMKKTEGILFKEFIDNYRLGYFN